jgi:hypothetical protein
MAQRAGRLHVGDEELTILREGYRLHRQNHVRTLTYVRQNQHRLPERVREYYRGRTNAQLRRRIRDTIAREIAE